LLCKLQSNNYLPLDDDKKNMNNSINIASASPQKASDAIASSATKNARDAMNSGETGELEASARSFHESIQKAYDDSKNNAETENNAADDNEENGNNLPEEGDFPELAADDDRPLVSGGLYLSGELTQENTQATKPAVQNPALEPDAEIPIDGEVDDELQLSAVLTNNTTADASGKSAETSSQLRQLTNSETGADTKKAQIARSRNTTGASDGSTEKTLDLKADVPPVKIEPSALTADKFQALINTGAQQQPLQNIQTSLLLQAASAQADAGDDALSLISNTPTNSFSSASLQSPLPQPAIAEAFGRPGWSQAMGKQILMMVNQNIGTAEIRLKPAHLGPIEVLIDMSDEQVSVSMSSRHAMVRDAMEQALPKLREMLEQNGFTLADADISKHSFAEQREQDNKGGNNGIAASNTEQSVNADSSHQVMKQATMSTSMVDYYI